jgi:FKBP-type peptidyl-prolyl cis-trans isomerase FklB
MVNNVPSNFPNTAATRVARAKEVPSNSRDGVEMQNSDKASYAIGFDVGRTMKSQFGEMNIELVRKGFDDAINLKDPILPVDEINQILQVLLKMSQAQYKTAVEQQIAANQKESDLFLRKNKDQPDIKVMQCGLQYKVLQIGNGPSPTVNDTVTIHYRGSLMDGTVFGSTYEKKMPSTFPLAKCLTGWKEALKKMKVGDKWQLFIPPVLAYGDTGNQQLGVQAGSAVIFEIELLSINK